MRGKLQTVLLAVALLFANAWCLAQCNLNPPQAHLPPCHKHLKTVCTSSVLVEAGNSVPQHPLAGVAIVPRVDFQSVDFTLMPQALSLDPSPPPPRISSPLRA